jgi:hypothetical protein
MLSATLRKAASRGASAKQISRGFAKEIKFGVDGRAAMLKGVETLADAVQVSGDCVFLLFSVDPLSSRRRVVEFDLICMIPLRRLSPTLGHTWPKRPKRHYRAGLWSAQDHEGWCNCREINRFRGQVRGYGSSADQECCLQNK